MFRQMFRQTSEFNLKQFRIIRQFWFSGMDKVIFGDINAANEILLSKRQRVLMQKCRLKEQKIPPPLWLNMLEIHQEFSLA